jgi:hypothetical protein
VVPTVAEAAISTALAVGAAGLETGEDLVRGGVDADKATHAAIISSAGLGLGLWAPVFGNSLATRVLLGGGASNVVQGIAERAAMQKTLEGTEQAKDFNPWDRENLAMDFLMGIGFGGLSHLEAAKKLPPSDRDAILVANQARHLEDTTAPGRPVDPLSETVHVDAVKSALNDLLNDRPVNVEQDLARAQFAPDPAKERDRAEIQAEIEKLTTGEPPIEMPSRDVQAPAGDEPAMSPADALADRVRTTGRRCARNMRRTRNPTAARSSRAMWQKNCRRNSAPTAAACRARFTRQRA